MSRGTPAHSLTRHRRRSNAAVALCPLSGLGRTKRLLSERLLFPEHLHRPIVRVWPHLSVSAPCHPSGRGRELTKSTTCARRALHGHLRETHMSRGTQAHSLTRHRSFSNASVALGTGYRGLICTTTFQPERRLFPQHLHGPIARVWPHHDISATCHPSGRGRAR